MKRRTFIRNAAIATGAVTVGAGATLYTAVNSKIKGKYEPYELIKDTKQWSNWSGNQVCTPKDFLIPKDEAELISKIKNSTEKIRIVGGGHSFSPVVPSNDILASIKNLKGIISHDPKTNMAKIKAGTRLFDLTPEMAELGYSFINQGDIDKQALAGAVSTSTHGTGLNLTSFAGMVKGFKLLTANGEIIQCNENENSELFWGGTVALGALGIVTEYDMQLTPKYKLKERQYLANIDKMLESFMDHAKKNRNFEMFPMVYSDKVIVKELNITDEEIKTLQEPMLSDDILLALGETLAGGSSSTRVSAMAKIMANFVTETERVDWAHKIYPSTRSLRFNEMEYELPMENGVACMRELLKFTREKEFPVFYPLEMRTVKQDDFWMSPFYKQDSISISLHHAVAFDYKPFFSAAHEILKKHGGRPHWGKLQYFPANELRNLYPKYDDFVKLKNELDPTKRFANDYINKLFV